MRVIRRHLASLGLAVTLCHVTLQVLVPAALCCERQADPQEKADCCAAAHPGEICPMHGAKRAKAPSAGESRCHARPIGDLHTLLATLLVGDVVVRPAQFAAPAVSEAAPQFAATIVPLVSLVPPGPPPRA